MQKNNVAIPINPKDTVYMRMSKDSAMYRPGISSRPMLGYVDITEGDNLNISQNDFQVKTVSANELVLIENKDILHTLSRINDSFAFERIKEFCPDCKTDPEAGAMAIDLQATSLIHKWSGYKTEANAGFIKPEMAIIRQLDINQSVGPMKYTGKVQFDKSNKRTTQDCTIEFSEDKNSMVTRVSIQTAGEAWNTEVFKADGKQMIMGKKTDGVRYYFRKID